MGTDIHGWVEVQPFPDSTYLATRNTWYGIVKVADLLIRDYDMTASLFGVENFAGFLPIAAGRGLPMNISESASDDYLSWKGDASAETWISWREIQNIDWSESGIDRRPHQYVLSNSGKLTYESKAGASEEDYALGYEPGREGHTWQRDGETYKIERITRQQALEMAPSWQLLFDMMRRLADHYGQDSVRIVAWFDC